MSKLLDAKDFEKVKKNILLCNDNKEEWKYDFIEFVNDDCDQSDYSFFYDSLPFVRFIVDTNQTNVAYTTPNKRIFMNAPHVNDIGESKVLWESIYFHECLHQLWDTFGVGEQIKEQLGEEKYNHSLLNIASDCVINEFIMNNMGRKMPKDLVDAELLKNKFNVEYDRSKDNQFTLYVKLLDEYEKYQKAFEEFLKQHPELMEKDGESGQGGQSSKGGQSGQGGQSGKGGQSGQGGDPGSDQQQGGNSGGDPIDDMSADEAAEAAEAAADEAAEAAKEAAEKAAETGKEEDKDVANKAAEAAKKAKDAAEKSKIAAEDDDEKTAKNAANEAERAAKEAKQAANKDKKGTDGKSNKSKERGDGTKQIADSDGPHTLEEFFEEDFVDEETNKMAEENIKNHKNRINEVTGEYISKTKSCFKDITQMRDGKGYKSFAKAASSDWDIDFKKLVDMYVKKQINKKKREMEDTYQRPNRRAGYVQYGEIIKKGRKIKEDKLNISMTFYIDKSGSMAGTDLENATSLAYGLSDAIEGKHKHEKKYIEKFESKFFTFNEDVQPIKKGQKVQDSGGNMSFDELLNVIKTHSIGDMINVIITDAGFPVNVTRTTKFVDSMGGLFIFVTNMDQNKSDYEEVVKRADKKNFAYVLADRHFDLHESANKI